MVRRRGGALSPSLVVWQLRTREGVPPHLFGRRAGKESVARPKTGGGVYPLHDCDRHGGKCWRVVYYDHAGQRRFQRLHGCTKPEAREAWMQLSSAALAEQVGARVPAERVTVAGYYRAVYSTWLDRDSGLAETTVVKRHQHFRDHLLPALGTLKLAELTTESVQRLRRRRVQNGKRKGQLIHPAYVAGLDRTLTAMAHHAAERGYFGERARLEEEQGRWRKPWKSIREPEPPPRIDITAHELASLIREAEAMGGLRLAAVVLFSVTTGARRGELRELRREHIRPVQGKPYGEAWDILVPQPKVGEPRAAYVQGAPARMLARYLDTLPDETPWVFPATRSARTRVGTGRRSHVVVRTRAGDQMRSYPLHDEQWRRLRERMGWPDGVRVHDLRGAYMRLLHQMGLSEHDVQRVIGHRSIDTTRRYLRTARTGSLVRAAEIVGALPLDEVQDE